jgi:hypothetical protein
MNIENRQGFSALLNGTLLTGRARTQLVLPILCDELQGYLLGKPVSAEEFTRLLIQEKQQSQTR